MGLNEEEPVCEENRVSVGESRENNRVWNRGGGARIIDENDAWVPEELPVRATVVKLFYLVRNNVILILIRGC